MDKPSLLDDLKEFISCLFHYLRGKLLSLFLVLETSKSKFANQLYQKRGKYARPFVHSGMVILMITGVTLGPVLINENSPEIEYDVWETAKASTSVLANSGSSTYTFVSEKPRAEIIEYEVKAGDTISSIAGRYGVSVDTVVWENELGSAKAKIKPGQVLRILPTTGIAHEVKRGETVYSIAKKYDISAQAIVDWPYNTFANDETFALAIGQTLVVPDGVMPEKKPSAPRQQQYYAKVAPPSGGTTGTGQFLWPAGGRITQYYRTWHRGIDIANKGLPGIAAADSGTVTVAGWIYPAAYGNRIEIDHGNGYVTLYAHLNKIYVSPGQRVNKGQVIGQMGSTGRSTGPHLHFEIRQNGAAVNPLSFLN